MRILVADDDRVISTLICGVLANAGHRATPALDAMQALMFAMRTPAPELIVLDVLRKPVDPAQLLDAVDRVAGRAVA